MILINNVSLRDGGSVGYANPATSGSKYAHVRLRSNAKSGTYARNGMLLVSAIFAKSARSIRSTGWWVGGVSPTPPELVKIVRWKSVCSKQWGSRNQHKIKIKIKIKIKVKIK